jgi:pimeloyl-ACP methyl ester carboxylesterase
MQANWYTLSPKLAAAGYCVFALDYGRRADVPAPFTYFGGLIPMEQSAAELGVFVDQVLAATGATKVDIVGHSQGSLMPNYYAKFLGGASKIGRYVGITPLWNGTTAGGLADLYIATTPWSAMFLAAFCQSCAEFFPNSDFITTMNAGDGPRVAGIDYTMLMTAHDELVTPYTSGIMAGATNIVIQDTCPSDYSEHVAMAVDSVVHQLVANALDPAHATPVVCGNGISNYFS